MSTEFSKTHTSYKESIFLGDLLISFSDIRGRSSRYSLKLNGVMCLNLWEGISTCYSSSVPLMWWFIKILESLHYKGTINHLISINWFWLPLSPPQRLLLPNTHQRNASRWLLFSLLYHFHMITFYYCSQPQKPRDRSTSSSRYFNESSIYFGCLSNLGASTLCRTNVCLSEAAVLLLVRQLELRGTGIVTVNTRWININ